MPCYVKSSLHSPLLSHSARLQLLRLPFWRPSGRDVSISGADQSIAATPERSTAEILFDNTVARTLFDHTVSRTSPDHTVAHIWFDHNVEGGDGEKRIISAVMRIAGGLPNPKATLLASVLSPTFGSLIFPICVPDAVQRAAKRSGAPLIRDLNKGRHCGGPGSAAHHFVLRRARDTWIQALESQH